MQVDSSAIPLQRYAKLQTKQNIFAIIMVFEELKHQILQQFGLIPTLDQSHALEVFARFLTDTDPHVAMILRGSAGTGKTSLSGAIVRTLAAIRQKVMLMAPTGRAAKVFSLNSGYPAYTIHRRIYREKSFVGVDGQFNLNDNLYTDTLFVVDEASMVSNMGGLGASFGNGCLLDDLVRFVYQGHNDRLMLIGDTAQLPPVGEEESPALCTPLLESYGLRVYECDLNEVLRQSQQSGILYNATVIRQMITHDAVTQLPLIRFQGFADIVMMPGNELVESLANSYYRMGLDETMVITRSNKRANIYNNGIRNMVLDRGEDELTGGDMLMIVKNNYFWTEKALSEERRVKSEGSNNVLSQHSSFDIHHSSIPPFLANGDRAKVLRVRRHIDLYGFHFATLTLLFPDYDDYEISVTTLLDTLQSEAPALTHEQQEQLFHGVEEDYQDVPLKTDRMKAIRQDSYFNALQVKYAYAVTCHKAQGGQWEHVYVDQGYMTDDMLTPDYIHWLYTAFTRAKSKLFLVNWPKTQTI